MARCLAKIHDPYFSVLADQDVRILKTALLHASFVDLKHRESDICPASILNIRGISLQDRSVRTWYQEVRPIGPNRGSRSTRE